MIDIQKHLHQCVHVAREQLKYR
ncbi:Protein of unknown function [Lactobacillus helveticus CIRM-BIA 101]|nr:Protein of unknown function [Lactobacillus helveticus CIRM-BIA 101]